MIRRLSRKHVALDRSTLPPASDSMAIDTPDLAQPVTVVRKSGKKGKQFTTKDSMLSIINQVSQVEESRLDKKMQRQKTIKKLVNDKESRSQANKAKKNSRLEEIKSQLRQGHSLGSPFAPSKVAKKKKLPRTLSAINRDWNAASANDSSATTDGVQKKSRKSVSFDV
ncbi:hypothetical protein LPJ60_004087 [Coemansia sp. RSA 2675]|uniref:Ribosome biogenesis protein SLX9 n=1 Tax=Coemansia spiralis TaxID=417178 RepID=A0A9W8GIR9_9FUNG|nr:hypothetical protein LPJ60_004087 [Coemansia sp. RSA 2675]KAJ2690058.1 hypothetical protein IWW39_001024 [Coemansia spiralis]KAJ2702509.1 hypothetical protein H4218_000808 [Coemansia sp. IMI 209128]